MNDLQDRIAALNDTDFAALKAWIVTTETDRRVAAPLVVEAKREQQAETIAEVAEKLAAQDTKLTPPASTDGKTRPWAPWHPLKPSTHFYFGDLVTHDGETWRNMVDPSRKQPNVWEPGSPGIDERYWVEVKPEPEPAPEPPVETPGAETPAPAVEDGSQAHPFNWEVGKTYTKGQYILCDGKVYKMAQTHTAVSHYRPGPGLESIYQPV